MKPGDLIEYRNGAGFGIIVSQIGVTYPARFGNYNVLAQDGKVYKVSGLTMDVIK